MNCSRSLPSRFPVAARVGSAAVRREPWGDVLGQSSASASPAAQLGRLRWLGPRWATSVCESQATSVAWSFSNSAGVRSSRVTGVSAACRPVHACPGRASSGKAVPACPNPLGLSSAASTPTAAPTLANRRRDTEPGVELVVRTRASQACRSKAPICCHNPPQPTPAARTVTAAGDPPSTRVCCHRPHEALWPIPPHSPIRRRIAASWPPRPPGSSTTPTSPQ
jgi:hypothetical protein